jgi:DNA-binding NarL/FixJ family response regulator
MEKYKIYICDDHQLFLESLEVFFGLQERYMCVGHAPKTSIAFREIEQMNPDIVLIDYHLQDENGLKLLDWIKKADLNCLCFMLTMKRDPIVRNKAREMGANGFMLKTMGVLEMISIFDRFMINRNGFFDSIDNTTIDAFEETSPDKKLSDRELQIARLVCKELSSDQIAHMLDLSLHTINTHRKNILKKINAKNAIDIMNHLKKHNLNEPD